MSKAPVKPQRPDKPVPPNKDQKVHKHSTDISRLFLKTEYWDSDGNETTEAQYEEAMNEGPDYDYEKEETDLTPSIKSLLTLIPPGTNTEDVFLDLSLGYDTGRNYVCKPFESISLVYTTPFNYDAEMHSYNKKLVQYEAAMVAYNKAILQYKKDAEAYKAEKDKLKLAKKKYDLETELALLNEKI